MEILVLCLLGYLFVSPDPLSLAVTRGTAGAARGAATGRTPSSKKRKPRGRALLAGWREGITAARTRREAGRDLWSVGSRGAGRVAGGTASIAKGIRDTVQARRNGTDPTPTSDASGLVVDEDGNTVTPPAAAPQPVPAAPETAPEAPKAPEATTTPKTPETAPEPAPDPAPTSATTPTNTAPNGAIPMSIANTELSNIDDYEKELKAVEAAVGLVTEAMDTVRKWGNNLPERWAAAGWGTAGLDRSVTNIAETVGALKMPALAEAFAAARTEVTKARGLGEAAEAVKARGKTEAFRGQ